MSGLNCLHCGKAVQEQDTQCPHCGIPLAPNHHTQRVTSFKRWFILLVIFCAVMMWWLPPDWSNHLVN
jgi:predicted nucleic acid-binding Zn ribbon protein